MATRHYLKLEGRLQMANLTQDRKAIADLSPSMERAQTERSELRRQIQEHEQLPQAEAANA